jgi:hypothetical protein
VIACALIVPYDCAGNENVIVDAVKLFTVTGIAVPLTCVIAPVHPMIRSLGTGFPAARVAVNSIAVRFNGDPEAEPYCRIEFVGSPNVMFVDVYDFTVIGILHNGSSTDAWLHPHTVVWTSFVLITPEVHDPCPPLTIGKLPVERRAFIPDMFTGTTRLVITVVPLGEIAPFV